MRVTVEAKITIGVRYQVDVPDDWDLPAEDYLQLVNVIPTVVVDETGEALVLRRAVPESVSWDTMDVYPRGEEIIPDD